MRETVRAAHQTAKGGIERRPFQEALTGFVSVHGEAPVESRDLTGAYFVQPILDDD